MWHKRLLVWLVACICTSANPLQPADETGQADLPILIPDLSNVDSYELQRIGADKFLTLWHINVLSGPVHISDEPWTVLVPQNSGLPKDPKFIIDTEYTRQILLNQVIIGDVVDYRNVSDIPFNSLADTELKFSREGDSTFVNGVRLTGDMLSYKNGVIYVIDKTIKISQPDYLQYVPEMKESIFNTLGIVSTKDKKDSPLPEDAAKKQDSPKQKKATAPPKAEGSRLTRFEKFRNRSPKDEPEKTENTGKVLSVASPNADAEQLSPFGEVLLNSKLPNTIPAPKLAEFSEATVSNESFIESLELEAKVDNSLAREFYYHLKDTKLNEILLQDEDYTAVIATDDAFYDYYPIDWGFNPFLVENFTKDVLLNHIIPGNINLHELKNGTRLQTLGGRHITIHQKGGIKIEVNGHPIPSEFEIEVSKGRIYYVDKLLFVDDSRVKSLLDQYPYLETGPLISYPWPTAPFLSHLVKRLKESPSNTIFVNLLLKSSVAHRFPTSDDDLKRLSYSAFVPSDDVLRTVFTKEQIQELQQPSQSFDSISGSSISAEDINNFILNHLFHNYIKKEDFNDTGSLLSMANQKVEYVKLNDMVKVGAAWIVGKQQYLYNLGAIHSINDTITGSSPSNIQNSLAINIDQNPKSQLAPEKVERKGISVPFPINPSSGVRFPSISNSDYRFETRTEVSFSKQINNGQIIPMTKEEHERAKRRTA